MADISDVEQSIADTVAAIIYPEGTASGSILGAACRIYRGWPNSSTLNADLSSGTVNITVSSDNDPGRITTRYWNEWSIDQPEPALTAVVTGQSIKIGGTPADDLLVGALVDGAAFLCRASSADPTALVAANLSSAIQGARPVELSGSTITIPGAFRISARVAAEATVTCEARRQEKDIRLIFWCPTPTVRDAVAAAVDTSISGLRFLRLADRSYARIAYVNTATYDQSQNALLYRRDLLYRVEYATMASELLPAMLFGGAGLNGYTTYG